MVLNDIQTQEDFGPSEVIVTVNIPFHRSDCFAWVWHHDWAGVYLGLDASRDRAARAHVFYTSHAVDDQPPKELPLSKAIAGSFAIRPIYLYDSVYSSYYSSLSERHEETLASKRDALAGAWGAEPRQRIPGGPIFLRKARGRRFLIPLCLMGDHQLSMVNYTFRVLH